ncbi:MAG: penicillin-binding protein 2 [Desulfobacteraceae bacterium]|nr:MAG: penicillin-binding protein 2 [Desulfobacteraceae bacterium]
MRTYLQSVDSEWYNQRLVRVFVVVLVAFAVLTARLLHLQIIEGDALRRLSEINSIRLQDMDAPRGLIYDRGDHMLVDNRPSFNLYIILKDARPLDPTLHKLSLLLKEPVDELKGRILNSKKRGTYTPILLKEDIGRDMLAAIEVHKFELPGVQVHVTTKRHYIYTQHAAHLLGYMGEINPEELQCKPFEDCKSGDSIGKFGIEKAYESFLRGKRGGRQVEVNAIGQVERILKTVDAQPGHDVVLTIDWTLQQKAEEMLAGRAGAAVAIDPDSGKVLAMASSPSFDPNQFVTGIKREQWNDLISNPFRPLENKALQAEYPPASTYKIVTAIAGLEEKVIDARTTFYCPGHYKYANRHYRCWKRGGHGEVDVVRALAESCDVFFYQTGEALGVDRLAKYAKAFGLGGATEVNLDREGKGLIPTAEWKKRRFGVPWQGGETLSIAIGQGFNLTTPIQMAVLAGAVGKSGLRYKPYIVEKIKTADGQVVFQSSPEIAGGIQLHPTTLNLVHQGLWQVVNHPKGTAWQSRIKELDYSGKTGTAQVVGRREGDEKDPERVIPKDHAWFMAYAPSINPKIAVAVIIEHGEHGSSAAAPVASAMIKTYLGADQIAPATAGQSMGGALEIPAAVRPGLPGPGEKLSGMRQ